MLLKDCLKTSSVALKKVKVKPFSWLYFEPKSEENHVTPNLLEGIPNSCRGLYRQNQYSHDGIKII